MTNKELQAYLKKMPDETEIKLFKGYNSIDVFKSENICTHAEDDTISEKGYLVRGAKPRSIVINPPIY